MLTGQEIVARLAEARTVETIARNVCKVEADALSDLCQDIYIILLQYDEKAIQELYEAGQLNYFIVRIIRNQYFGKNSEYNYRMGRGYKRRRQEISEAAFENLNYEEAERVWER